MAEQEAAARQRPNAYDQQYYAPKTQELKIDPANIYIKAGWLAGALTTTILLAIWAVNFRRDTEEYQRNMTTTQHQMSDKISDVVKALENMTTARDLSDFCMMAQQENPGWKCPAVFQWRRSGYAQPAHERKNVTRIELGSNRDTRP